MVEVYKNFINGKWCASKTGKTFENINPADKSDIIGLFQKSCVDDVKEAFDAAHNAQKKWRLVPAPRRAEILFKVARILEERKEEYARLMTREMGKVLKETRGDIQEGIDMAYYAAGEGRRMFGETVPSEMPDKFAMSIRMPLGVVSAITPWNFPMAIPCWKLMPAIVTGNTAVIKPATYTPLSVINLVKVFEDAGLPAGVLNVITGVGSDIGNEMMANEHIKVVSFTGSTEIGLKISVACAQKMKQVSLEMGGKNAIIVMDDADLDMAVEGALWGAFGTSGQRCTATSRLIVHERVHDKLINMLSERAKKLKVGNGLDSNTDMGPVVSDSQLESVYEYIQVGKKEGAKLVTGGEILDKGEYSKGYFLQPTIFTDVTRAMRIFKEEIFGPVLSVIKFSNFADAIDIANDSDYGLSSSIYTRNINLAFIAMRELYTGICYINAPTIGAEIQLPFGGTKATGNGHREAGSVAIDTFTEWKSVYVDFSGKLQKAQIDQFEENKK
jgi:alpha-ketoglutaric semialdehyde dehydrogenase